MPDSILGQEKVLAVIGIDVGKGQSETVYRLGGIQGNIPELVELLGKLAYIEHYYCEDEHYSCPKHPEGCTNEFAGPDCDCGADEHNAKVDEVLNLINACLKSAQS